MDPLVQIQKSSLFNAKTRQAIEACIANRDAEQAAALIQREKGVRVQVLILLGLFGSVAMMRIGNWIGREPLEFSGVRFYAVIFSTIAAIFFTIAVIRQYRKISLLKEVFKGNSL